MSRRFPKNLEGNARCTLMFPVSVCFRIGSKRFVEEETQRMRLQDGSLDRIEEAAVDEKLLADCSKRVQRHARCHRSEQRRPVAQSLDRQPGARARGHSQSIDGKGCSLQKKNPRGS